MCSHSLITGLPAEKCYASDSTDHSSNPFRMRTMLLFINQAVPISVSVLWSFQGPDDHHLGTHPVTSPYSGQRSRLEHRIAHEQSLV